MLSEIQFVDSVLKEINRPKDYTWASKMGAGGRKSGIEIWKIPHSDLKKLKRQLVETESEQADGTVKTTAVSNPNPKKYGQRRIQWIQQLLNPEVSHDTVRDHNKVIIHDTARAEYDANDQVINNYVDLANTTITEGGVATLKAYSLKEVKKAVDNSASCFDLTKSNDPKEFAEKALSSLEKVKDDAIPHNNNVFKTTLRNIQKETERITENPRFSTDG